MLPLTFATLSAIWTICFASPTNSNDNKKVVFVLIDGFANWYLDEDGFELSGFKEIERNGIRSEYLLPEFPTVTKPNFFSMLSGLFPENHGISGNFLFDTDRDRFVSLESSEDMLNARSYWNKSDLVWSTAQQQGKITALYSWPVCFDINANIGSHCTQWSEDRESDLVSNIPEMLKQMEHDKMQFVMIYYSAVGIQGHDYGPHSGKNKAAVKQISTYLYQLQHALTSYVMWDNVNLVVTSTSGMTSTQVDHSYFLDDFLPLDLLDRIVNTGAYMWLYPKDDKDFQIYQALDGVIPNTKLYWKDQFPRRWRLGKSPFLAPLLLVAKKGYGIYCRDSSKQYPPPPNVVTEDYFPKGLNGYDNANPHMKAIFLARGPEFKQNIRTSWLRAVDVYQLICRLLHIKCPTRDSSIERVDKTFSIASQHLAQFILITVISAFCFFL